MLHKAIKLKKYIRQAPIAFLCNVMGLWLQNTAARNNRSFEIADRPNTVRAIKSDFVIKRTRTYRLPLFWIIKLAERIILH